MKKRTCCFIFSSDIGLRILLFSSISKHIFQFYRQGHNQEGILVMRIGKRNNHPFELITKFFIEPNVDIDMIKLLNFAIILEMFVLFKPKHGFLQMRGCAI